MYHLRCLPSLAPLAFLAACLLTGMAWSDEGMWLFNNPPRKVLQEKYGFDPTDAWLGHLQRSSVRFNSGGSGEFVSSDGLVMTNHHVAADALQKLSTPQHDYIKAGFYAKTRAEEVKCLDLELNVLMSIEDVTARVNAGVKEGLSPPEAAKARRAVMSAIEKESLEKTGLRSDVVTLYNGGLYHLYRYKKYTDVRLVFAPEVDIAFFGGDPDNFEYPRYDLDISFFRVYENGQPAHVSDHLAWSANGAGNEELIFVSGHPGRTDRLNTVAHLEYLRDRGFPYLLDKIRRREVLLVAYSQRSLENKRRAKEELFMYQNSRKARLGGLAGLQDPSLMREKAAREDKLRKAVAADPQLARATGDAWNEVAATLRVQRDIQYRYDMLEMFGAFNSHEFMIARTLLRMAEELPKPNGERLREYRDSNLESLRQQLFSAAPIYDDLETAKLADSLSACLQYLGAENELVRKILDGQSPPERAAALVHGTKLANVAVRHQLAEGGLPAIEASPDPMLALARLVDRPAREVRKTFEEKIEEPQRQAYAKIAKARFAIEGTSTYPDATFTLRLAFGVVKGYEEAGKKLPPWTMIGGTYEHAIQHGSVDPFELPASWLAAKDRLKLDTPFNFVSTADIIGGNSGSPVVNRQGELVGIIFDGNLESLVLDFIYTEVRQRAISVHSSAIREALRTVYHADTLADELGK